MRISPSRSNVYFMSYHTTVTKSYDFYSSLESARELAADVKEMLQKKDDSVEFFPYRWVEDMNWRFNQMDSFWINTSPCNLYCVISSIFYVYYEQYLTIWKDSLFSLMTSLAAIFIVSFILIGCDFIAAFIILFMVTLIVINMLGMMWLWNISLNAISLVNLVVVSIEIKIQFRMRSLINPSPFSSTSQLGSELSLCRTLYEHFARLKAIMKCARVKHFRISEAACFRASHWQNSLALRCWPLPSHK